MELEEIKDIITKIIPILIPLSLTSTVMNLFMKILKGGVSDKKITEEIKKELEQEEIDKIIYEGLEQYASAETKEEDPELIQEFSNKKLYIEL